MTKTVAIFSPKQNAYSETFIQAHKKLPFNIKFYYGGALPSCLESEEAILEVSFPERIRRRVLKGFSFPEKRLLFSLRKEKVDCVLAEYGPTACESLKVIRYLKIPMIVHFHGYDASQKDVLLRYAEKYKEVFEYAQKIIVVSNKMKESLLGLGCAENKLNLNYYGPDDSFYSLQPTFNDCQFVSVGRFVDKKAPHLIILAFKQVIEAVPEAKLIMVGDGELLTICKSLVRAYQLEKSILFPGILKKSEIKDLFQHSIALVQHSVIAENGDSEGTPVAVLEAQAAGLPVISTYHGGIPDVVINGETGLLSNEFDIESMAANMKRILKEKGLAKQLGDAGRKRVNENFSMEKHLGILQNEIEKSLVA